MKMTGLRLVGLYTINLPLHGAKPSDEFILTSATGLGPVEMDVSIARGVFRRRELRDREVVARIGFNPDWSTGQTAEDLRHKVYGLLDPAFEKDPIITLNIMDGTTVVARTQGVVRLVEIVPFSKDPEVQVTISCLNSDLDSPNEIVLVGPSADPATVPSGNSPMINNPGDKPVGFDIQFKIKDFGSSFSLYSVNDTKNKIEFDFTPPGGVASFYGVWIVTLNTIPGQRDAYIKQEGAEYGFSLLPYITEPSVWPVLLPGNRLLVISDEVVDWMRFKLTPKYWGI